MLLRVNTWSNINSLFDKRELIVSGGIEFVTHPLLVSHRQSIRQVGKVANYCAEFLEIMVFSSYRIHQDRASGPRLKLVLTEDSFSQGVFRHINQGC